jgi:DNA invertase Pin-like site-specific DNA recombinase
MTEVVGVYARLSRLRGRTENIDTQHELGTTAAHSRWPGCTIRYYADPDASGEREDVVRDDYERLKADVLTRTVTQVTTSDQERLTRRPDELERLITVFRTAGVEGVLGYRDGWTSLVAGQSAGARYKGVGAKEYVEGIKVKTNEKLDWLASSGRPSGGYSFGYRHHQVIENGRKRSRLVVVADEAAAARWAAEAVLAGWSLAAVGRELDARGATGRRNGRWTVGSVRQMLSAPTIAGKRVHRGEVIGDGEWEPILDEVTWQSLVDLFESRTRSRPARRYLLTGGLGLCACGAHLVGSTSTNRGKRRNVYACHKARSVHPDGVPCGHVYVGAAPLEEHVTSVLLERLRSDEFAARVAAGDVHAADRKRLSAALGELEGRRRRLAGRWARGDGLDDDEWEEARAELVAERARINAELAALPPTTMDVDPGVVAEEWPGMTGDERRRMVRLFLSRVVVARSTRRGSVFDTSRIAVFDRDGVKL